MTRGLVNMTPGKRLKELGLINLEKRGCLANFQVCWKLTVRWKVINWSVSMGTSLRSNKNRKRRKTKASNSILILALWQRPKCMMPFT